MGEVVAVANQKGGVGKTTTTENLAVVLGQAGRRILVVDVDPQFALTRHLARDRYSSLEATMVDVLAPVGEGRVEVKDVILRDVQPGVDLLPTTRELRRRELGLVGELRREGILAGALAPVRDDYDFVLIDCPPNLGLLTVNALYAADRVLAPVSAEDEGAAQGVAELRATLRQLAHGGGAEPELVALMTRWDGRRRAARGLMDALAAIGVRIASEAVPSSAKVHQAPIIGQPVAVAFPDGTVASSYRRVGDELFAKVA